jgi:hypothetical protein
MPTTGLPHNRPAGARHRRPPVLGIKQRDRWLGLTELFRPLRSDGVGAIGRSSLASTLAMRPRNTYADPRVNGRTDPEVDQTTAQLNSASIGRCAKRLTPDLTSPGCIAASSLSGVRRPKWRPLRCEPRLSERPTLEPMGRASRSRSHTTRRTATVQGNTEGTRRRASAGTHGHASSAKSFFLRGFRARSFPPLPSLPASELNGKEGVSGSSPEEGLKSLQIASLRCLFRHDPGDQYGGGRRGVDLQGFFVFARANGESRGNLKARAFRGSQRRSRQP